MALILVIIRIIKASAGKAARRKFVQKNQAMNFNANEKEESFIDRKRE